VTLRSANLYDWDAELDRIIYLLNSALKVLPDHVPLPREGLEALATSLGRFIDADLVIFGQVRDEPVG